MISPKIASTVHDTFHAFMLSELDRHGKTTPDLFEKINLRLAQSVTARNALGRSLKEGAREIATMLYGEVRHSVISGSSISAIHRRFCSRQKRSLDVTKPTTPRTSPHLLPENRREGILHPFPGERTTS